MNKKKRLTLAIQSKGRLYQGSMNFLTSLGLFFPPNGRKLINSCMNFDLDILYVRSDDIPEYVRRGVADFGIVGENVLYEKNARIYKLKGLGFGKCSLVIAVPQKSSIQTLQNLEGLRIATSYPETLRSFLQKKEISAKIIELKGACEIAPNLNISDAICDITQTGTSLQENNLEVLSQILTSEACFIESPFQTLKKNIFLQSLCKF